MKSIIKVKFIGFYRSFDYKEFPLFNNPIISDNFEIVICDDPDFVFYGCFGNFLDYITKYNDSVKILIITEPMSPDFTFFDYVFSFDPYDFGGRNVYYPSFLYDSFIEKTPTYEEAHSLLSKKDIFCDFIYSHEVKGDVRKHYYNLLNSYKKVESAGKYLNNQKNGMSVTYANFDKSKFIFQSKSKFSLCIQSCSYPWFVNEKISHAIMANEIPIFIGPTNIKKIFNEDRIICVNDYENDNLLLEHIKTIDLNDDMFCKIISKNPFVENDFQNRVLDNAYNSLRTIFVKGRNIVRETEFVSARMIARISKEHDHYCKKNTNFIKKIYNHFLKIIKRFC